MPVIPTYRAGVGAPNLAEAYLGSRRIAQQAASDAARIQLGREQLAQEAIANQMELAAKREAMAQQAMKQAQEAEIEKAYRETQIGLSQRELANEEAIGQMRIQEAKANFDANQEYRNLIAGGKSPDEAMRIVGFGRPGFPNVLNLKPTGPRETASDRALRYKYLQSQKEDAMIRFGPKSQEYQNFSEGIDKQIESLFPKGEPAPSTTQLTPPAQQQWQVNPETIPFGAPGNPQIFIGTPGGPVPDPGMQPLREGFGIPPPAMLPTQTRTGTTPNVGDIIKGYRFKGGDPSIRSNWEKVK